MTRIGEYELGETIATGAYAKVKHATHIPSGTKWAAKILPKTNRDVERDIRTEISVLRRLNHENVLRLNEILESQNNYYIILELAMGGDLCDMVSDARKGLPEALCVSIFTQIIAGLKACHANRVAHRDLKPENILFTAGATAAEKRVKISDFGLSRLHQSSVNEATATEFATTLTGTMQYVAPEVLSGRYDAFKADLWSLGCILYAMLTSNFPFGGAKDRELEKRIKAGTFEKLPAHISEPAQNLVKMLLEVDPSQRPSMDAVVKHPFLIGQVDALAASNFGRANMTDVSGDDFHAVDDVEVRTAGSPTVAPTRRRLPD